MHLAIDASNIRQGGGITHLSQLLSAANPYDAGIKLVTVWGSSSTLAQLPEREWLIKLSPAWANAGFLKRMLGQQLMLNREMASCGCNILFSPGGTVPFQTNLPVVTMSQNMLPFEPEEAIQFGRWSWMRFKMWLLRQLQGWSFKQADGLIFLSKYARDKVCNFLGLDRGLYALIPHGIERRFTANLKVQHALDRYSFEQPFTFLYVSILMPYKHQIKVAKAAAFLRQEGYPIQVKFVGAESGSYGCEFHEMRHELDPKKEFLIWLGSKSFSVLHNEYHDADAFVFASSCENLPNILIEAMASGLPIASSRNGPMQEVLEDAGIYFDPLQPSDIAEAMRTLLVSHELRGRLSARAKELSRVYSWQQCAKNTFEFISEVATTGRTQG